MQPYQIPVIPLIYLRFSLQAEQTCSLPRYKGSMLRGAFGHALKSVVCCMRDHPPCARCIVKHQCTYVRLFEPFIQGEPPPLLQGLDTAPRPLIFDAFDVRENFVQNDLLSFSLTLLGNTGNLYPFVILAVAKMAQRGLSAHRYPFKLVNVQALHDWNDREKSADVWPSIYDHKTEMLLQTAPVLAVADATPYNSPLEVHYLTPVRVKMNNELVPMLNFRQLVFRMLRRTLEIAHFYAPENDINWEFHELLNMASGIKDVANRLDWLDWMRHSNRQQADMQFGGFVGTQTFAGDFSPFSHLLRQSEMLHIGKGTMFGLGKIRLEE